MKCYGCGSDLRVTHTYGDARAKTQAAKCSACGKTHTLVTLSFETLPGRGNGAEAVANEIRRRAASGEGFVHGSNGAEVRILPRRTRPSADE